MRVAFLEILASFNTNRARTNTVRGVVNDRVRVDGLNRVRARLDFDHKDDCKV